MKIVILNSFQNLLELVNSIHENLKQVQVDETLFFGKLYFN